MTTDFVRDKGYLTLGTRLKRIGETLQAEVQQMLDADGVPLQTAQFPILAAIDENGPSTVGDLVEALGVSQPGITRSLGQLVKQGVVKMARGREDQRTKVVTLTAKGCAMVAAGKSDLWPLIDRGLADICGGMSAPLLDQLDHLETELQKKSLFLRVMEHRKEASHG